MVYTASRILSAVSTNQCAYLIEPKIGAHKLGTLRPEIYKDFLLQQILAPIDFKILLS